MLHLQVRNARLKAGLTLTQLARLARVHRSRLHSFEHDGRNITVESLRRIVEHLPLAELSLGSVTLDARGVDNAELLALMREYRVKAQALADVSARIERALEDAERGMDHEGQPPASPCPLE
ncbi:MAG TPA: helix-turn-helix transcriptional regulator [Thermoanaerobaculia bacterium]|nr:helix-turn-helix transcriptional regulator [Thermoanaerobaculia bacterium]